MDGHDINSLELSDLSPEDFQELISVLQTPQISNPEQFQIQPFQNNVTLPPQPQSHTGQLPFPVRGDPSGVLNPLGYMLRDQPDNMTPPPQPHSHAGQQPLPVGEGPSGIFDPSDINVFGNQPTPPPYSAPVEAPVVQEDEDPEHVFPGSVGLPPVQDPAAGLEAPADPGTPQFPCPICGRRFNRAQERNRHVRAFLPHWIHCPDPSSRCPFRCDRRDNLVKHWKENHTDSGQAPQKHQQPLYQIYDPDRLVAPIVSGEMLMELAENIALSEVATRAQELGKEGAWGGNLWGRRRRPHTDQH